jgi:hypothetical protein
MIHEMAGFFVREHISCMLKVRTNFGISQSTSQDLSTPGSIFERFADRRDEKELPYLRTVTRADSQLLLQRFQVLSSNARKNLSIGPRERPTSPDL